MRIVERAHTWITSSSLAPSTLERYAFSLRHVVDSGIERVDELSAPAIGRFLARRREDAGVEVATCNRDLTAVCSFVHWLVRQGDASHELLFTLRDLYDEEPLPPPIDWITRDEYRDLRRVTFRLEADVDLGVALATGGGFRLAELRRLRHEELILEGPETRKEGPFARVLRTYGRRIKRGRERSTPLPRVLARELLERGFGRGREGWVFPARYEIGRPVVSTSSMQGWLLRASSGLGRHLNWITLRHTFASWHIQKGRSFGKVAKWMGNSVAVCERHYAALAPGGDREVDDVDFPELELERAA